MTVRIKPLFWLGCLAVFLLSGCAGSPGTQAAVEAKIPQATTTLAAPPASLIPPTQSLPDQPAPPEAVADQPALTLPDAPPATPSANLPALTEPGLIAGWNPDGVPEAYDANQLGDVVGPESVAFTAYHVQDLYLQDFYDAANRVIGVEVWRMAEPEDAFGLFTTGLSGVPVQIGNEGDAYLGQWITFWQDVLFVRAEPGEGVSSEALHRFALDLSRHLPAGGAPPDLARNLPQADLQPRGVIFFHEEISIMNQLFLGSGNPLGLSGETDGVLAQYHLRGAPVRLLLIRYPNEGGAQSGLDALLQAPPAGLILAQRRGKTLGAVFDNASESDAASLLESALAAR